MAAILETEEPIHTVHIDGLAVLKIVKHCQESLPAQVTGSLLGLTVDDGILEITHAFPFPKSTPDKSSSNDDDKDDDNDSIDGQQQQQAQQQLEGDKFQLEMMKMFREVNIDNNCIGWYKSIYLGSLFDSDPTSDLLENHFDYQTSLSPNAVVIVYDPSSATSSSSSNSLLGLKCLRLTDVAMDHLKKRKNTFLNPREIFEEVPLVMKNTALVKALLHNVKTGEYFADEEDQDEENHNLHTVTATSNAKDTPAVYGVDTTFERLDMSTNPYLEKHLEFLCSWVDDLSAEQSKFQYYMRGLARNAGHSKFDKKNKNSKDSEVKVDAKEAWESKDAPRRLNSLLVSSQIRTYCEQVDKFADGGLGKLFLADSLHREEEKKN